MINLFRRRKWKKASAFSLPRSISLPLLVILPFLFLYFSYTLFPKPLLPSFPRHPFPSSSPSCGASGPIPPGRFLWYAPHSGFSNQLSEFKNALLFAVILNRTLIVPPVLDHHAVALGSCPKFRVSSPTELRMAVWDHVMELVRTRRYLSMTDIVDISSVVSSSMVKTIDFRVFASSWCGLDMGSACYGKECCSMTHSISSGNSEDCGAFLSGQKSSHNHCIYAVEDDCRTTVWTYKQNSDDLIDSFQPDEQLKKKKKISYVRKRRDLLKSLGPGSNADKASVLSFGSLFTAPYKGSELYINIHEVPEDGLVQSLLQKVKFLPYVPEIISAGKEFAKNKIKMPFLCAQLRLLDGQFKNHWKATFFALKQKVDLLVKESANNPISIFVMTDLPKSNWSKTYLGELEQSDFVKLFILQEVEDLVRQTANRLMTAERGIRSGYYPKTANRTRPGTKCGSVVLPDVLLYIEQSVCSCASLGFVGTVGSTIAASIELMRERPNC